MGSGPAGCAQEVPFIEALGLLLEHRKQTGLIVFQAFSFFLFHFVDELNLLHDSFGESWCHKLNIYTICRAELLRLRFSFVALHCDNELNAIKKTRKLAYIALNVEVQNPACIGAFSWNLAPVPHQSKKYTLIEIEG